MRNDATYLDVMAGCIEVIDRYLATAGDVPMRKVMRVDGMIREGVVRRLEVLCDPTGKLRQVLRGRYPRMSCWVAFLIGAAPSTPNAGGVGVAICSSSMGRVRR